MKEIFLVGVGGMIGSIIQNDYFKTKYLQY